MAWKAEASPRSDSVYLAAARPSGEPINRGITRAEPNPYSELEVVIERKTGTFWCHLLPTERPSFTPRLLKDLQTMQASLKRLCADPQKDPIQHFVVASRLPGIFNLGGDLVLFGELIRRGDRGTLRRYAIDCIDVVYSNAVSYDLPLVTIALVQGDALGGGFEAALSCDVIVAEKGARFGLPEILFNLFPGMGAYSLLARRIGGAAAEKLILSGQIYTAEELHAMGLVHVLVEPGEGEAAVRDYIDRNAKRHNGRSAVYQTGRRVNPLSYQELKDVVEIWVDAALKLSDTDLRKMERLSLAQNRRWSTTGTPLAS